MTRSSMLYTDPSEEGRRFFQERLALTFKVGFGLNAAFLASVVVVRGLVDGAPIVAELRSPSRVCLLAATFVVGAAWLYVRRGVHALSVLRFVDIAVCLLLCVLLDLAAAFFPLRTVAVFNLILTTGIVLVLRAVVVPSPMRRTLLVAGLAAAAAISIFIASLRPGWPVSPVPLPLESWPTEYQFVTLIMWLGTLVTISIVASRVIYGLRREMRAAQNLGQYVLGGKIGEGGMGVVFRATHAMLRRETALKLLLPERVNAQSLQRFEREVLETARLRHPNTVAIYDYGRTPDGIFYYAMEYLDGLTAERLVGAEGPLSPGRVVHLLAQVCASLDEAHAARLIHRDIKPANIMILGHSGAWDLVKVLDFGLVKDISIKAEAVQLSNPAFVIGTPQYMSPEAISAPDDVGPQSDLYAVAAVGYFLLTGTPVFMDRTMIAVCAAHLDEVPEMPSVRLGRPMPEDLEKLIMRGLMKRPEDRPASAQAFRQALLACDVPKWTEDEAQVWWGTHGREGSSVVVEETSALIEVLPATVAISMLDRGGDST